MQSWAFYRALIASALAHAALVLLLVRTPPRRAPAEDPRRDAWAGHTLDVEAALYRPSRVAPAAPPAPHSSPAPERAVEPAAHVAPRLAGPARAARSASSSAPAPRTREHREPAALEHAEFGSEGLPPGVRRL